MWRKGKSSFPLVGIPNTFNVQGEARPKPDAMSPMYRQGLSTWAILTERCIGNGVTNIQIGPPKWDAIIAGGTLTCCATGQMRQWPLYLKKTTYFFI